MKQEQAVGEILLGVWDPEKYLREVEPMVVRLSRGFLRCRPERWAPGIAAQWLPIVHALGVDIKFIEAVPIVPTFSDQGDPSAEFDENRFPADLPYCFVASVDDEVIGLQFDIQSGAILADAVVPSLSEFDSKVAAKNVVLDYIARRFFASFSMAWTGPQVSRFKFEPDLGIADIAAAGAIKIGLAVNGQRCSLWLTIGAVLANKLDGLWRRQLLSTNRGLERPTEIGIEIAQLAVPPAMLAEYTRRGTIVDLEVAVSENAILRQAGKPWLPVKLLVSNGCFAVQTLPGPVPTATLPEGTTRLSLQLGNIVFDGPTMYEMTQAGSIFESDIEVSDQVVLVINGEKIADATLCTYEGRFAISVN